MPEEMTMEQMAEIIKTVSAIEKRDAKKFGTATFDLDEAKRALKPIIEKSAAMSQDELHAEHNIKFWINHYGPKLICSICSETGKNSFVFEHHVRGADLEIGIVCKRCGHAGAMIPTRNELADFESHKKTMEIQDLAKRNFEQIR